MAHTLGKEPQHCRSYLGGFPVVKRDVSKTARIDLIDHYANIVFDTF